jgi:hypothetical protein
MRWRFYDAIEAGVADLDDPALKDRIDGLKAIRDSARVDAERAQAMLDSSGAKLPLVRPIRNARIGRALPVRLGLSASDNRWSAI